jgi:hypothetical protein
MQRGVPWPVICEIVNDDGTMARVPDLIRFCKTHGLAMVTVADLAQCRLGTGDGERSGRATPCGPFVWLPTSNYSSTTCRPIAAPSGQSHRHRLRRYSLT